MLYVLKLRESVAKQKLCFEQIITCGWKFRLFTVKCVDQQMTSLTSCKVFTTKALYFNTNFILPKSCLSPIPLCKSCEMMFFILWNHFRICFTNPDEDFADDAERMKLDVDQVPLQRVHLAHELRQIRPTNLKNIRSWLFNFKDKPLLEIIIKVWVE